MILKPSMTARCTLFALLAATVPLLAMPVPSSAQAAFNGTWSVLIITDDGPCDRAYRYPVRIANGQVSYAGQADFDVVGKVTRNGAVRVTVSRGNQRAGGSGRLAGDWGSGTWRGDGDTVCSGRWTAEKRG
jgi:hypothetical protein